MGPLASCDWIPAFIEVQAHPLRIKLARRHPLILFLRFYGELLDVILVIYRRS